MPVEHALARGKTCHNAPMMRILDQENLIVISDSGICSSRERLVDELARRAVAPRVRIEGALPQGQVERSNPDRNISGNTVRVAALIAEFEVHNMQNWPKPYWAHVRRQWNLGKKLMQRAIGAILSR